MEAPTKSNVLTVVVTGREIVQNVMARVRLKNHIEDSNDGGTSTGQIESEIAKHEENIAQLEHQLEYIEGSINRTQIQQQIIEEQYEIRRLKAMLNGM